MTATAQPATGADSNGDPQTVGGGITRLNATDGLFLRAEHLAAMQDYARELAFAAGLANGTGVVYGFTVTLSGDKLEISPGLAIDPSGRPLRSRNKAEVPLSDLVTAPNRFWVLEVVPAHWVYGTEKAFGSLCDDPCNGSTIVPWQTEGLTIQLREESMPKLEDQTTEANRRSWLASQYFERERKAGGPWLTPSQLGGGPVSSIIERDWSQATPQPAAASVPIAVLQHLGKDDTKDKKDKWLLDVWTARRDMGDPPARRAWQSRLAMRPWNVFLAQVLQFQAQLAAVPQLLEHVAPADTGELIAKIQQFVQEMVVTPRQLRTMVDSLAKAAPTVIATAGGQSLQNQGFVELPSAGFLQMVAQEDDSLLAAVKTLFGNKVNVRICHCRADHVPHGIEQAQHLDRIPLGSDQHHPKVDILVPDQLADLPDLKVDGGYGWVAFVRRRDAGCEEEPVVVARDEVGVYLIEDSLGIGASDRITPDVLNRLITLLQSATNLGPLSYPAGDWAYPGGEVVETLVEQYPLNNESVFTVVALTYKENRRPLAALRASLFAASFDTGIAAPPVFAVVKENAAEAIVVVRPSVID